MRLRPEQLDKHLAGKLLPVYVVSGDEPLLQMEVCDQIRAAASAAGYSERDVYTIPQNAAQFDWSPIRHDAASLSLFARQRILEIRLATTRLGEGAKVFEELANAPPADTLLLITAPKLDRATQNTRWVKTLDTAGALIQIWPIAPHELPKWIDHRLRGRGIRANAGTIQILADRVEGNLLAAAQEVDKLCLLAKNGADIDEATLSSVVANSARYSVFTLVDRMLAGQANEASRTLRGLQEEGTEPMVVLWALNRELRTLVRAGELHSQGQNLDAALKATGVWESRKGLLRQALQRLKVNEIAVILRLCGVADRTIKGMLPGDPWQHLTTVILMTAGVRPMNRESIALDLQES